MKKRFLSLLVLVFFSIALYSQSSIGISTCVNGAWSSWKTFSIYLYGSYSQISQYYYGHHPSEFIWRVTIDDFYMPNKTNDWLEFSGTMEYYITDKFPDAKSQFLNRRQQGFVVAPWNHDASKGDMPCVKKTASATIKIAPYKKHPKVYNIWFDGVGFAIDLQDSYFRQ